MPGVKDEVKDEVKDDEKDTIEITVPEKEQEVNDKMTEEEMIAAGHHPEEIRMAKEHNLVKTQEEVDAENEKKEQDKKANKDEEGKEEESEDKYETTTEDELTQGILDGTLKDDELVKYKNYTKNVRKLYGQQKTYQERAQKAEKGLNEVQNKVDLAVAKANAAVGKLDKIKELFADPDAEITEGSILKILDGSSSKKEGDDKDKPLTKGDLEEIEAKKEADKKAQEDKEKEIAKTLQDQMKAGQDKYGEAEFDRAMELAKEVMEGDPTGVYAQRLMTAATVTNPEPGQGVSDVAMALAKLHPDFGKKAEQAEDNKDNKEDTTKKDVEKIIKNSEKKPSSASVSGSGKKIKSFDDLTSDDVLHMSQDQWNSLPDAVRQRLMSGG